MSLFSYFGKSGGNGKLPPRAAEMARELSSLEATVRYDWERRVNGGDVYAGYRTLREFYRGQQWSYRKDSNGTMRTYNYLFTVVENYTAFLTNEPPQMSCPPADASDAVERILAEARTKVLSDVHRDNQLPLVFQRGARVGSMLGDSFIFGPIPTFTTDPDTGERKLDRIRYWNVERPECIRPIWKDENFNEMAGFVNRYRVSVDVFRKLFAKQLEESGVDVSADYDTERQDGSGRVTEVPMVTVKHYWTDTEYVLVAGGRDEPIEYVEHGWGFLPIQYVPNIHLPGEPQGTSDIEHELDAQQEYNERSSDLADIIKATAWPTYIAKNVDEISQLSAGNMVVYSIGEDGEINPLQSPGQTFPLEQYLGDRKNDIIGLSGLNSVLYPGSQVLESTGRALSVIMQGVNNKVSLRKEWWAEAFRSLNRNILFLLERYYPESRPIVAGRYDTDVFISSVLLRNVTDELNKFNAKAQSLTTTMHNIGISNPSEEQKLMREELQDPILSVEISRQPALLQQVIQQAVAQASQAQPAVEPGGMQPMMSEGDNVPGDNPVSARGQSSPLSPASAVAARSGRAGVPPQIPQR